MSRLEDLLLHPPSWAPTFRVTAYRLGGFPYGDGEIGEYAPPQCGKVREMARLLPATVLGVFVMLGTVPGARAQIPPLDDTTDTLEETVEGTVEAVETTLGATTGAVGGTGGGGTSAVEQGAEDAAGSVIGSATESTGGTVASSGAASGEDAAGSTPGTAEETRERGHAASREQRAPKAGAGVASVRVAAADHGSSSVAAAYVPLLVRLTNDADSDGSYSDVEVAPVRDSDVPFQVQLENTGSNELAILAIRNASAPLGQRTSAVCSDLSGVQLAAGESATCRFTVKAFAPPEGERAVIVLEVDAADAADPSATGTVTDPTVIRTEHGSVLGLFVRSGLDFLATTGARIGILVAATLALVVSGALLITIGNRRRAVSSVSVRSNRAP